LTAASVSGAAASAPVRYTAAVFLNDVVITAMSELLPPVTYAVAILSATQAATGSGLPGRMGKLLRDAAVFALKTALGLYVAWLLLSGLVSGSADAMAVKGVKVAVSAALPVVGGIIADTAETVLNAAKVVRSTLGITGLVTMTAITVTPFLRVAVQYLCFRAASILASAAAMDAHIKLLDDITWGYGLILGVIGAATVLLMISVAGGMVHMG